MRALILITATAVLIGGSVQAAAPRAPAARPEFTTRSPAGYVYRRAAVSPPAPPQAAPSGDVAPAEVTVPGRPRAAPNPAAGQLAATSSSRGAVGGGVGVNVELPMTANRGASR